MVEIRHSFTMETDALIIREFALEDLVELGGLTRQTEITDMLPDWRMSDDQLSQFLSSEAVRVVAAHVFECTSLGEIVAIVKPVNAPSRRVVEKAGFEHRRRVTLSDQCEYDYFILSKAKERC